MLNKKRTTNKKNVKTKKKLQKIFFKNGIQKIWKNKKQKTKKVLAKIYTKKEKKRKHGWIFVWIENMVTLGIKATHNQTYIKSNKNIHKNITKKNKKKKERNEKKKRKKFKTKKRPIWKQNTKKHKIMEQTRTHDKKLLNQKKFKKKKKNKSTVNVSSNTMNGVLPLLFMIKWFSLFLNCLILFVLKKCNHKIKITESF